MKLNLKSTNVFDRNYAEYQNKTRNVVNQGGSRSSKTYSIAQLFLVILTTENNVVLTVARKTLPSLRATAMRDFFDIIKGQDLYREANHNKSDLIYKYKSNEVEFISVDQPQKIRGRKRRYLWLNEANEFSYEDYKQLNMRTTGQLFFDFNPSDEFHWIYDHILTRDDTTFIQSTYKDNPFLEREIVKEIEMYRKLDQNYWRIYGLGERGISELKIYTHWQYCDELPEGDEMIYGLDFGYNNQTALVKIVIKDQKYYWDEVLYKTYMTNNDLIEKLKELKVGENAVIYADSAEPQRIEEIHQAGFNIKPSDKDVNKGIDTIKSKAFLITKQSVNLLKEVKSYSWKEKDGKPLDEPVKQNDHLLDAGRYAIHTHAASPQPGFYAV